MVSQELVLGLRAPLPIAHSPLPVFVRSDHIVFGHEDAHAFGGREQLITGSQSQFLVPIRRQVDAEGDSERVRDQSHPRHRAGRIHVDDFDSQAGVALSGAAQFDFVRADIGCGIAGLGLLVFGVVDREPAQVHLARFQTAMEHIHMAQEVHHERRGWVIEHILRRARLLDVTLPHHDDLVGDFERFFLVVSHEHRRDVHLFMQLAEPRSQLLPHFGIERSERLVEQQQSRLDGQSPRKSHTLPLSPREFRG